MNSDNCKVVLNLHVADELIKRGFPVKEIKASTKIRGRAVFIFDRVKGFDRNFSEIMHEIQQYKASHTN